MYLIINYSSIYMCMILFFSKLGFRATYLYHSIDIIIIIILFLYKSGTSMTGSLLTSGSSSTSTVELLSPLTSMEKVVCILIPSPPSWGGDAPAAYANVARPRPVTIPAEA
mmetsp:Transcript_47673/g.48538  ORF Transcript_47673/g.48538 Transcript_47673/m.48538 type:complete len:111 (-) Transcript_47673:963-1295(-)